MMLNLRLSTKFKKDYARCRKRQYDMELLQSVVDILRIPAPLPLLPISEQRPSARRRMDRPPRMPYSRRLVAHLPRSRK